MVAPASQSTRTANNAAARASAAAAQSKTCPGGKTGLSPKDALAAQTKNVGLVSKAAAAKNVPQSLAYAVAYHESQFCTNAKSWSGVKGVMQVTQRTAKGYGFDRNKNDENIKAGMAKLNDALKKCSDDAYACLAKHYNGSKKAEQQKWAKSVEEARRAYSAMGIP